MDDSFCILESKCHNVPSIQAPSEYFGSRKNWVFSLHFARGAKRCPIFVSSPVAVYSGNSCPSSLTYWDCERAISKRQFLCCSFRHFGTQHARSSIAVHELRILTRWFFKLLSSTRAAFYNLHWCAESAGALIMYVRLTVSELSAPFPDLCTRLTTLPYVYTSASLPLNSVGGGGACFIHKKRCTSRTSSRYSCPCHCTSTYHMHGI